MAGFIDSRDGHLHIAKQHEQKKPCEMEEHRRPAHHMVVCGLVMLEVSAEAD
jgi:hypothetical protein